LKISGLEAGNLHSKVASPAAKTLHKARSPLLEGCGAPAVQSLARFSGLQEFKVCAAITAVT
jgi:hypothetical protein